VLVVTSAVILGTRPSALLVASLVPVVVGVSVASATELCFNWIGFASAMASNLASALRNTYSKACLGDARGDLSSVNLLAILSMMASVMMIPLTLALEVRPPGKTLPSTLSAKRWRQSLMCPVQAWLALVSLERTWVSLISGQFQ
jgi:hypothetical protein